MKTLQRISIITAVLFFGLAAVAVAMYALGKPVTVQAPPEAAAPAPAIGKPAATPAGADPAKPSSESDPLAIEIPGCVCHSDDPDLVAEHAAYRMSECFDCHQGGMPGMDP